jgi:hypothetical protein
MFALCTACCDVRNDMMVPSGNELSLSSVKTGKLSGMAPSLHEDNKNANYQVTVCFLLIPQQSLPNTEVNAGGKHVCAITVVVDRVPSSSLPVRAWQVIMSGVCQRGSGRTAGNGREQAASLRAAGGKSRGEENWTMK